MTGRIIVTGSKGFLGSHVTRYLQGRGHEVLELDLALGHDLRDEAFVSRWFQENPAGSLVNLFALNDHVNSSGKRDTNLFSVSLDSVRDYCEVNLVALFSVCRAFAKANQGTGGSIVNFSSIYGVVSPRNDMYDGQEKHIGYSISKGAVPNLTRHLAVHLAPKFRVNCVVPGGVENAQSKEFLARYAKNVPAGRMMKPDEANGLVEFLCSDASSYMNGSVLAVDGGWTSH